MKRLLPTLLLLICLAASAQRPAQPPKQQVLPPKTSLDKTALKKFALVEDTLKQLSNLFVEDSVSAERKKACYAFIPKFAHALKADNSFYYPFDSLGTISKVYPPDSSFRIFTWQLLMNYQVKVPAAYSKTGRDTFFEKPVIRYYGVIQMRSSVSKLFPLYDAGDTLKYGTQQILGAGNWWGQLYYSIIQKSVGRKSYYTLFGYEAADLLVRRKIIDILTFDDKGQPKFGAPMFYVNRDEDSLHYKKSDTLTRFFIEYKHSTPTVLRYDPALDVIIFDHVAPPDDKAKGATFSYVPDGTYEGFKWGNDHWNWMERIFTFSIDKNDSPPVPVPKFGEPKDQPEMPKEDDKPK